MDEGFRTEKMTRVKGDVLDATWDGKTISGTSDELYGTPCRLCGYTMRSHVALLRVGREFMHRECLKEILEATSHLFDCTDTAVVNRNYEAIREQLTQA